MRPKQRFETCDDCSESYYVGKDLVCRHLKNQLGACVPCVLGKRIMSNSAECPKGYWGPPEPDAHGTAKVTIGNLTVTTLLAEHLSSPR